MSHPSQFTLLRTRRFLPFFVTQSLGAFNDNLFKQSLILAILYKLTLDGDRSIWVNLCALLFILPFFLFSALAGQFGEKFAKDASDPSDQARRNRHHGGRRGRFHL